MRNTPFSQAASKDELEAGDLMFGENKEAKKIPDTAKVISSDLPSPWADLDSDSDTH